MTAKQLFDLIDKAGDKFLKEAMEDEVQYPEMLIPDITPDGAAAKKKLRFPIKPIAACAACLAVILGLTFIGRNIVYTIDPFFGKPARGVISRIAEKDMINYNSSCTMELGNFSYQSRYEYVTDSNRIDVTSPTAVSGKITLNIQMSEHGYPSDNVPARVFLLADGKPVDFKLNGEETENGHPELGVDVVLRDPVHEDYPYYLSDTFDIEFNASNTDEQFAAVATFYPDDVFDLQESVMQPSSYLTAVNCVRNSAAKVSYDYGDYKPDTISVFGSRVEYTHDNNVNYWGNNNSYFKRYILKKNIECDVYRSSSQQTAYRQYFIMDGKLLNCFGNEYLEDLDCHGSEYFTLIEPGNTNAKFTIPGGFIPSSGTHTIQTFSEPIIPESINETTWGYADNVMTFTCGESFEQLEQEAQKFKKGFLTWGGGYYPVRATVSTDESELEKGGKLKFKATIRNYDLSGSGTVMLYSPSSSAGVSMYIYKKEIGWGFVGDSVELENTDGYYLRGVDDDEPAVIELDPGEEYNVEFTFDGGGKGSYEGCLIYQVREDKGGGHIALTNETVNVSFRIKD